MAQNYVLSFYLPPFEDAKENVQLLQEPVSQEFVEETVISFSEKMGYERFLHLRESHHEIFQKEDVERNKFGLINYLGREMPTYGAEMGYLSREDYREVIEEIDEKGIRPSVAEEAKNRDWVSSADIDSFTEDLQIILEKIPER